MRRMVFASNAVNRGFVPLRHLRAFVIGMRATVVTLMMMSASRWSNGLGPYTFLVFFRRAREQATANLPSFEQEMLPPRYNFRRLRDARVQ